MLTAADRISSSYPEPSCMNAWEETHYLGGLGGISGKWGFFLGITTLSDTTHFSLYPRRLFTYLLGNTSSQLSLLATSAVDTRALSVWHGSPLSVLSLQLPSSSRVWVRYFIREHAVGPKKCCLGHDWNFGWLRNMPWQCSGIPGEGRQSKS